MFLSSRNTNAESEFGTYVAEIIRNEDLTIQSMWFIVVTLCSDIESVPWLTEKEKRHLFNDSIVQECKRLYSKCAKLQKCLLSNRQVSIRQFKLELQILVNTITIRYQKLEKEKKQEIFYGRIKNEIKDNFLMIFFLFFCCFLAIYLLKGFIRFLIL
jgi:hypothetical protein